MRPAKPSSRRVAAAVAPASPPPTMMKVRRSATAASSGQGQEFLACTGIVAHRALERGGHRAGARLLDAAQRHAEVLGLEDDADALRAQVLVEPARHLGGQPLLDLQRAREQLDDA